MEAIALTALLIGFALFLRAIFARKAAPGRDWDGNDWEK